MILSRTPVALLASCYLCIHMPPVKICDLIAFELAGLLEIWSQPVPGCLVPSSCWQRVGGVLRPQEGHRECPKRTSSGNTALEVSKLSAAFRGSRDSPGASSSPSFARPRRCSHLAAWTFVRYHTRRRARQGSVLCVVQEQVRELRTPRLAIRLAAGGFALLQGHISPPSWTSSEMSSTQYVPTYPML
jgi:hypothetical protein